MTLKDARAFGSNLLARLKNLPLSITLVVATVVLGIAVLAAFEFSGERYTVLFDGLSPARGGKVISALQKEGIPYRLSQDGNVISVPESDFGRARLRLGVAGLPETGSESSWQALEKSSVTTSQAATQALQLQATEHSLQESITALSGASQVQVLLAEPKDTPFLADQPRPKASVILTAPPQADQAIGMAIAKVVAGAVPGLDEADVVVATSGGMILYPQGDVGDIAQQLAVLKRIEAAQEAKIRSLLAPILGAGNARVTVSADIDFAATEEQSVRYGPNSVLRSSDEQSQTRNGKDPVAMGIPGALSNQPPGKTTAPLNANGQGAQPANGQPQSASQHTQKDFVVDKTSTTRRPAAWSVRKVSASVVVNKAALGSTSLDQLKAMIGSTIAGPVGQIQVTSANFVTGAEAVAQAPDAQMSLIVQAGLLLVAALGFLFGVARPLVGWLRKRPVRPWAPAPAPVVAMPKPALEDSLDVVHLKRIAEQVGEAGKERPKAMAGVLQKWLSGDVPSLQPEEDGA
ncbi:flagellar basal-body MS-ring/collar protein FliF [uncultured Thioclava sp.]|uniref:flagellar basal-body MS-ring/collar protein FliF n=1 Tax=uncultured Thioclava sp. TaxID=473858 RepID=UPI0025D10FA6|nr:flagellar basal-body MS-ring/collar protein FliF [uncultured Thioclava sp.]